MTPGISSNFLFNGIKYNPEEYAKRYAKQNKMNLEDVKIGLKEKYGEPTKIGDQFGNIDSIFNSFQHSFDPNQYASIYAQENGLTLEDAKIELEGKYGQPNKPGTQLENNDSLSFQNPFDPDQYASIYAQENGLTLEDAKLELKEKYGEPDKLDS